jgi:hypothetical protein
MAVGRRVDLVALPGEGARDAGDHVRLVVDHEHSHDAP